MVASTHLRPYDIQRLVRTVAPATAVARSLTGAGAAAAFPSAIFRTPINTAAFRASNLNFNSAATRISVVKWTMLPCAVPRPYTHPDASAQSLGFRRSHSHISSASSPYSSSAEEKGKIPPASGPLMPPKMCPDDEKGGGAWCSKPSPPHPLRQRSPTSRLLNLPTILTLGRVAAVPLLVGAFYINSWWGTTATTSIFIAAAITDWLDGYIARKMKLGTAFGAFLDPVADKLMVAVTLVLLCSRPFEIGGFGQVPLLLTLPAITIIGREITMSAVREWAASQNSKLTEAVAVNNLGKWKTAMQMTALTILLASRDNNVAGAGIVAGCGVGLLNVSAGLAMWSLVVYMRKIWPVLLNS